MPDEQFGTIALKAGELPPLPSPPPEPAPIGSPLVDSPPLEPADDATVIEWAASPHQVVPPPASPPPRSRIPTDEIPMPEEVALPPASPEEKRSLGRDEVDAAIGPADGAWREGEEEKRSLRREEVDAAIAPPRGAVREEPRREPAAEQRRQPAPEPKKAARPKTAEVAKPIEPPPPEFSSVRFHFTAGVAPGDTAQVCDDSAKVLMTYRGFASALGTISIFVAGLVLLGGLAGALLLLIQNKTVLAFLAFILGIFFALAMIMLIPVTNVVLMSGTNTLLKIVQVSRSSFPVTKWKVVTPEGQVVGILRKSVLTRLWRNRWTIADAAGKRVGYAREESLGRALLRAFAGKFNRRYEANVEVVVDGHDVAMIYRRPDDRGAVDVLQIYSPTVDRRIAVALATLILGSEP